MQKKYEKYCLPLINRKPIFESHEEIQALSFYLGIYGIHIK